MKYNTDIYELIKFKREDDVANINRVKKRRNSRRNQPDDALDGAIWIRKYKDISFYDGIKNFANFIW